MQKKLIIIFGVIFLILLFGYAINQREELSDMLDMPMFDSSQKIKDETEKTDGVVVEEKKVEKKSEIKSIPVKQVIETTKKTETNNVFEFSYSGPLVDVSDGNATGVSTAGFANNTYRLFATFENLPEPQGTDFYEGWIVRKGLNFSVLSTGKAIKKDEKYINTFNSDKDLTDHDFYVLTLEPDDGDPAPAAHILEGTMKLK